MSPPPSTDKRELRRWARKRRQRLFGHRAYASLSIRQHVTRMLCGANAETIGTYAPMHGEPEPADHDDSTFTFAWPKVNAEDRTMHFLIPHGALCPEPPLNIPEPRSGTIVPPSHLDAILVPGLLFSPAGARLGYGGGFYDRYLPAIQEGAPIIGICYGWQVVDELPMEDHDVPMHFIISERGVLTTSARED